METYICIGKCVPTPAVSLAHSPSRSPSSDRTSFTRRVPPSVPPRPSRPRSSRSAPVLRSSHSYSRYSLSSLSRSRGLSFSRSHPRSRRPAFSHGVPLLVAFFPRTFFFFLNTPPSRPVIFIICYLLRHTPPAVVAAVAATAVCPARPTRKNRKIEENKSGRRGAPRIPQGGALGRRWREQWRRGEQGEAVESRPGERRRGWLMKKEKGTAGPRRNGSSTRVRVRAVYPARAAAENYFSATSAPMPAGNSHRICEYRMRVPFAGGRYRLIFLSRPP